MTFQARGFLVRIFQLNTMGIIKNFLYDFCFFETLFFQSNGSRANTGIPKPLAPLQG